MTDDRKLDNTIGAWLEETAPAALPEHVLTATFERTRRSRQDLSLRDVLTRLRTPRFVPVVGSAAVVVVAVLALNLGPLLNVPGASPSPSPTTSPSMSPGVAMPWWPQTSLEEVRAAQEAADAGDSSFNWQRFLDGGQLGQHHPCAGSSAGCWRNQAAAEIFRRFLVEKLGWQDFFWDEAFAHREELVAGDVLFVRCAPGGTNPLYRGEPETSCGPTIDELRYETVKITVSQPDRQGPGGLWVVTGWEIVEPAVQVDPAVAEAEVRAALEAFLQARIDGASAEELADYRDWETPDGELVDAAIPLLYAATSGAPYERFEFEIVEGPVWPHGTMRILVRLFAQNGETVVEQRFTWDRFGTDDDRPRLVYNVVGWPGEDGFATTENGKPVAMEYDFLDGLVTFRAALPLAPDTDASRVEDRLSIVGTLPDEGFARQIVMMLADPRPAGPGCLTGPKPTDAADLARMIGSDPDSEATAPVAVSIGGLTGLQLDVVRRPTCGRVLEFAPDGVNAWTRARLYLVDLPGDSARVLALIVMAEDDSFETVLSWATPVIESIEFHAP